LSAERFDEAFSTVRELRQLHRQFDESVVNKSFEMAVGYLAHSLEAANRFDESRSLQEELGVIISWQE
jgi:hypothetical protein